MTDSPRSERILFVDLNNSARFPALAVGYLVATLRNAGFPVEVLSPLSQGVPGFERDLPDRWVDHLKRRIYFSSHPWLVGMHDPLRRLYKRRADAPHPMLLDALEEVIRERRPSVILVSAYLDHRPSVEAIGERAARAEIPVLLGGPIFNVPEIRASWQGLTGVSAVFGGEAEEVIVPLCEHLIEGKGIDSLLRPDPSGAWLARRLESLADLPLPDFSDFPWHLYGTRVLTVMTGRGCGWGRCTFCSDVITANGRGFRSRPVDSVMHEISELSRRYDTPNTFFLDIKLNSDLEMWRGIIERYQSVAPGGRWIGTVHVAAQGDNGLDRETLANARAAGMARISFGLETGSETLNRRMAKGTQIERTIQFLEDARAVGLSVRTSMMLGYPGESEDDVRQTAEFLERHGHCLDRVRLSRFKAIPGTRFETQYQRSPERYTELEGFRWRHAEGRADYTYRPARTPGYRKAKARVLAKIYAINRRPLASDAAVFNGLM